MNINKRLDRMKQWAGERMGSEVKTNMSDDFKALETEMTVRHEGMERLQRSMTTYVKTLTKVKEADDKEKALPLAYLGSTMMGHGDDFEPDSEFGQCLSSFGRANERIARMQENYVANATSSWLESLERSLAQMKEYQAARKKLESRRLAFDTSQIKLQKSKREDFRMEEEARAQKAKYEESQDDVYRRMLDIKEAEAESVMDLTAFLDAELAYYDRARDVLMQCRREWPARGASQSVTQSMPTNTRRPGPRSRSNTASSFRGGPITEEPEEEPVSHSPASSYNDTALRPPPIRSRQNSNTNSPRRELPGFDLPSRPTITTTSASASRKSSHGAGTFEGPTSLGSRDASPMRSTPLSRVPTDGSGSIALGRGGLRPVNKRSESARGNFAPSAGETDVFGDPEMDDGDYDYRRDVSPARSYGSNGNAGWSRSASWSAQSAQTNGNAYSNGHNAGSSDLDKKRAPPPPPPSRAKKPPPPPPPMKRSALNSSDASQY